MNSKSSLKFLGLSHPIKGAIQYPLNKIIFGPYISFFANFKFFCYVASFFALIISLVYILCGQSLYCYFVQFNQEQICSFSILAFIFSRFIVLYLGSMFCVRYYQIVWQGKILSFKDLFRPSFIDIRSFIGGIVFLLINSIAFLSWYLLKVRVPNPDWRIELCYFGFVGLGLLTPFVVLRFYPLFVSIWSNKKMPNLLYIWQKSRGNNLSLILSVGFWVFLWSFSSSFFLSEFGAISANISYWGIFIGEYIYNFTFLAIISCFINNCALQYSFLQKDNSND